ncbi:prepilin-type N-terminal cleavage/methylation domain-containing protein, partial [Candidatus Saccharibacteria bacterium]|nr:prepilin-type N-terminal cleavage/methylation domain-containing protein [Candidatus Saccharibacteria bacterium]
MSVRQNKLGFTALELILVLVIVGLIGLVGYKIYNTQKENDRVTNNTEAVLEQTPTTSSSVPAINSASDLEKAEKALAGFDSTSADDEDLSQLDS